MDKESAENRRKEMAMTIWLNYINRCLFEEKTISERTYRLMTEKILSRNSTNSQSKNNNP